MLIFHHHDVAAADEGGCRLVGREQNDVIVQIRILILNVGIQPASSHHHGGFAGSEQRSTHICLCHGDKLLAHIAVLIEIIDHGKRFLCTVGIQRVPVGSCLTDERKDIEGTLFGFDQGHGQSIVIRCGGLCHKVLKFIPGPVAGGICKSHLIEDILVVHDGQTVAVIRHAIVFILVDSGSSWCIEVVVDLTPGFYFFRNIHSGAHGCEGNVVHRVTQGDIRELIGSYPDGELLLDLCKSNALGLHLDIRMKGLEFVDHPKKHGSLVRRDMIPHFDGSLLAGSRCFAFRTGSVCGVRSVLCRGAGVGGLCLCLPGSASDGGECHKAGQKQGGKSFLFHVFPP